MRECRDVVGRSGVREPARLPGGPAAVPPLEPGAGGRGRPDHGPAPVAAGAAHPSRPAQPTIGELASYLLIRHHSAVQLADRVEALGLVRRHRDDDGRRLVRLQLTPAGARRRAALGAAHLEELRRPASLATAAAGLDAAAGAEPHRPLLAPSASERARSRPTGSTGWARLPPAGHPWRAPSDRPPRTRRPWR